MKKKLHLVSIIIVITLIIAVFIINNLNNSMDYRDTKAVLLSLIGTFIFGLIVSAINNFDYLKLIYYTQWKYRKEMIRISFSYLYKIKVNDKYLLVPNSNYKFYQPVGGVYKYYSGAQSIFDKLDVTDDDELSTTGKAKEDLRKLIPSKNLISFIKWFESGKAREVDFKREFDEELVDTGFLNIKDFRNIKARKVKRIKTPIHKAPKISNWQFLIYDIIEVEFTEEQQKHLEKLEENTYLNNKNIKWASDELVEKLGVENKKELYNIARHTKIMKTKNWVEPGKE